MPAKRAYGMDQDLYPWSPIVLAVLRWLDNARVALAVIVNLEHWDWEVPSGTPAAVSATGGPEGMWTGNPSLISAVTATTSTAIGSGFLAFSPCWISTASHQPWRSTGSGRPLPRAPVFW
jgi:hypothetical protein